MPSITRTIASASLFCLLALGGCTGNDSLGSGQTMQPGGQDAGQTGGQTGSQAAGGHAAGGRAGTGGRPPAGADGSTPVPVTPRKVGLTAIGSVTYFDIGTQAQAVAIATDGAPWFTASGQLMKVAADDTVSAWSMPAPGGLAPSLVSDGLGKLWVALWGPPASLSYFDPPTHTWATAALPAALARPTTLASNGMGAVEVSGGNEPIVGGVNAINDIVIMAMESAPLPITLSTAGLALSSDGQTFVSDYDQGRIGRIAADGSFIWTDLGGAANAPSGLAADVDGSVWFVSLGTPNEVGRIARDGTLTTYPLAAPTTPISDKSASTIARAADGSVWFALPERGQLGKIATPGGTDLYVELDSGSYPVGVAFDPSGQLWFTNNTGFGRLDFTSQP